MLPGDGVHARRGAGLSLRILFVEDSDDDAELMLRRLRGAGIEPQWDRVDGEQGLTAALATASWDVALVDFNLPGFSGPLALATVAEMAPDVPAITVSGAIDEDTAVATLTGGAVDYVLKDNLARLAPAVRRAVEGAELRRRHRAAEERARLALFVTEHSPVGEVTLAEDGTIVTANPAYAGLRGVPRDALPGQRLWDGNLGLSEGWWEDVKEEVRRSGSFEAETQMIRLDGEERTVDVLFSQVDYRGERYYVGWVRDVTQRRRAEAALEAEEANLAAIFESSPVAMLVMDAGLNVVRVNQATVALTEGCDDALLDYDPASAVQCGAILSCIHDAEDPLGCGHSLECPFCPLRNSLEQVLSGGAAVRGVEMAFDVRCDGEVRRQWVRVGAQPVAMNGTPHVVVALDEITDSKRAEEALRESEELYRMLAETMNDVVWVLDVDEGRFVYVSPSVERVRGYTPREIMEAGPLEALTAGQWDELTREMAVRSAAARELEPGRQHYYTDEIEQPCRDGSTMWSELVTAWTVNPTTGHVEARGVSRDITQRRRAEHALRESETHFRAFFEQATVGMATVDVQKGLLEANEALCAMLGREPAELRATAWETVTHPDDAEGERELHERLVAGALDEYTIDKRLLRSDGEVVHAHLAVRAVRAADGSIDYIAAVIEDITDRERVEAALRESEHRFSEFADHLPGELFIRDRELRYAYVNRGLAAWHGVDPSALIGKSPEDLMPPDEAQVVRERCERAVAGTLPESVEEWRSPDGEVHVFSSRYFPVPVAAGETMLGGISFDVTEEQRAQAEVVRHAERLRRIVEGAVLAMGHVVETRDPYTAGHERRVAELAVALGAELGLEPGRLEGLRLAALIHDIGKIAVPAEILAKPGRLSEVEFSLIRQHARAGYEILAASEFDAPVAEIVLLHHERLSGAGYPAGLAGGEILFEARILAVADTVEAMSSHRPYRPALGMERALEEVRSRAGSDYDPEVAAACLRVVEQGFAFRPEPEE